MTLTCEKQGRKFKDRLPQDARQQFFSLVEEEKTVAQAILQAALDTTNSMARSMVTAVIMHRNS